MSKKAFRFNKTLLGVLILAAALLLAGCGGAKSTRAKADETVHTALFDFTCGQAEVIDSYNGIDIPEGDKLVQFHVYRRPTPVMSGFLVFKDDFQLQWGDGDSRFWRWLLTLTKTTIKCCPEVTCGLSAGSTRWTGNLCWWLCPQDTTTLTVAYQEALGRRQRCRQLTLWTLVYETTHQSTFSGGRLRRGLCRAGRWADLLAPLV